ncbi:T9SS type B sorting domain-containing protein [uncultured Flavobacterium sp.]|uniref:T9SS type B sorting domain-containing protein n=1 Tax=uncultured Flavobacterium sp. TaxID=165435 RepID=UPI0025EED703|nr:T9SS type B sorting domain-containing protein [uncultured Flavobacterium sp.]
MKLVRFLFVAVFCFTVTARAQLADFDLQVTKTDETCLGNGSLNFVATGLTSGSEVIYKVYLLPDVENPISISVDNYLVGLSSGSYKVVAIQALNDLSNFKEEFITVNENIVPFNFSVFSTVQNCADDGSIIVNVTSGTSSAYEIISGPVLRPLQTSNVFNGLSSGTYNIRAFDDCGNGKVTTYTLSIINSDLDISDPFYSNVPMTECDSVVMSNMISASSGEIGYPLSVEYTLNTMDIGGEVTVINQTITNGPATNLEISEVLPRYIDVSYSYDLKVVDNCNEIYEKSNNIVDPSITLNLVTSDAPCADKYLLVDVGRFFNSFTIEFLSSPDGFNPTDFNVEANGSFTNGHVEFGSPENPVPFGNYVIKVLDECGREFTESILIELVVPSSLLSARNNGCFSEFGKIRGSVPNSDLTIAIILEAPDAYDFELPRDVSSNIYSSSGILKLNNMPLGTYVIRFTDDCGFVHEQSVEVPPFVEKDFNDITLPACEESFGSVRLRSGNGKLTEVIITSAPSALGQSIPYDVSFNIDAGKFYMGDLPEGNYIFKATDICGIMHYMEVTIEGYAPSLEDNFVFTPNCSSFSIEVTDISNGTEGRNYWLQRFDPDSGNWVHPRTGIVYTEGNIPNSNSGIRLTNNSVKNNLNYNGTFRILKKFETFSSGISENTICISELGQFNYNDELSIGSAYAMACLGEPDDIYLEAMGYQITYKILKKDGVEFIVDNGDSNIFTALEPAVYLFSIEDACGNVVTQLFNFQELPSIATASQPNDMLVCVDDNITNTVFNLRDQDEQILGPLFSVMHTITYHLTEEDAENDIDALPDNYANTSNGQIIYARLEHNEINICHSITSFKLFVGNYQEPEITTTGTVCKDIDLELMASEGYDSYLWSTGETTRVIYIDEPGVYSVIVSKEYGTEVCESFTEMDVIASEKPEIIRVETTDWTEHDNSITVYVEGNGIYEYSIDGINYQDSNVFEGLKAGLHKVYVRDTFGCGEDSREVVLMYYPKFFTPNGDGVNEKWYIKYAVAEPNFNVTIYDRYGKIITYLNSESDGWDGTLQGVELPSTDYWFIVKREDGREFKGHFSMIR